jgi:hypothetical protein
MTKIPSSSPAGSGFFGLMASPQKHWPPSSTPAYLVAADFMAPASPPPMFALYAECRIAHSMVHHAFGVIGTAISKKLSVFQSSSLKVAPITPNTSNTGARENDPAAPRLHTGTCRTACRRPCRVPVSSSSCPLHGPKTAVLDCQTPGRAIQKQERYTNAIHGGKRKGRVRCVLELSGPLSESLTGIP